MNGRGSVLHDAEAHAKARIEHSAAGAPWVNFCLTSEARLQAFHQSFLVLEKHGVFHLFPGLFAKLGFGM
jgi:hypothetical protein